MDGSWGKFGQAQASTGDGLEGSIGVAPRYAEHSSHPAIEDKADREEREFG